MYHILTLNSVVCYGHNCGPSICYHTDQGIPDKATDAVDAACLVHNQCLAERSNDPSCDQYYYI